MSEPASRTLPGVLYPRIAKSREALNVAPDLANYERIRGQSTWDAARALLDGLPSGRGLNIAHEAVHRHVDGPRADRSKIDELLQRHHINRAPIVKDGKVVGIVSRGYLVQAVDRTPDALVNAD